MLGKTPTNLSCALKSSKLELILSKMKTIFKSPGLSTELLFQCFVFCQMAKYPIKSLHDVIWMKLTRLWYTRGQTRGCSWEKGSLKVGRTRQLYLVFHMYIAKWSTWENAAQLAELVMNPLNFPFVPQKKTLL